MFGLMEKNEFYFGSTYKMHCLWKAFAHQWNQSYDVFMFF